MAISVPRYTIEDIEHFPRDGNRYELVDGILLVTPAPNLTHQVVIARFLRALDHAVGESRLAYVVGPGAVQVAPSTHMEPDLLVFPTTFPMDTKWIDVTERWLAVEVYSRSSRMYDREFKRDAYFAAGVAEVWLVDWRARSVEVVRGRGQSETVTDLIRWRPPRSELLVTVNLQAIFEGAPTN